MILRDWQPKIMAATFALRNLGFAATMYLSMDRLRENVSMEILFAIADPMIWVALFGIIGVLAIGGALVPRAKPLRYLFSATVGLNLATALSILASGDPSMAMVSFFSFAIIDAFTITLPLEVGGS